MKDAYSVFKVVITKPVYEYILPYNYIYRPNLLANLFE